MKKNIKKILVNLRTNFIAGLVISAPILITFWLIIWILTGPVAFFDHFIQNLIDVKIGDGLSLYFPGFGIIIAFIIILFIGVFVRNFVGKFLVELSEKIFSSTPLVKNLYSFFKNVVSTVLQQSEKSFRQVALVEFPKKGMLAICFVVNDSRGVIAKTANEFYNEKILGKNSKEGVADKDKDKDKDNDFVNIFIPTSPNPTSGFLLFVPKDKIKIIDLTVEEAAKVCFSAGMVDPHAERVK